MTVNQNPVIPSIPFMAIDDKTRNESQYQLQIGDRVKYLRVAAAIFDRDTPFFSIASLPPLPYDASC